MQITTAQLNQAAALLGTTDKNLVFAAIIKTLVDAGLSVKEAFEAIFGEGSYVTFTGQVYEALRAKVGV
jgi:hypothetical protein